MTAPDFERWIPELGYMAHMVEAYCQGPVELVAPRIRAARVDELKLMNQIAMRLLANGARDLKLLGSRAVQLEKDDPEEAARLEQFIRAIMPIPG